MNKLFEAVNNYFESDDVKKITLDDIGKALKDLENNPVVVEFSYDHHAGVYNVYVKGFILVVVSLAEDWGAELGVASDTEGILVGVIKNGWEDLGDGTYGPTGVDGAEENVEVLKNVSELKSYIEKQVK